MFYTISWQSYWMVIALTTAGYYVGIYLLYYRRSFKINLGSADTRIQNAFAENNQTSTPFPASSTPGVPDNSYKEDKDFLQPDITSDEYPVYACMDEINAFLDAAKRNKCVKEDLVISLQNIVRKYPQIKDSPYKDSLTNVIIAQCETACSVRLREGDVVRIWSDR